ncbi:hemin transporter [Kiloniella litopenaei]|uniref:Hemin transporter n=1 Tax=Kiloniella litopenaei TaxID=1549748 RepID=A0A0M2R1I7_9PROT|nr:hemin-degrading factor [Kiloniella litopenaei]KKJ75732.1 hemin transporter [Kiloniella litopenaei]
MNTTLSVEYKSPSNAWTDLSAGTAKGYARDIARAMNITEAQLVAAGVGDNVIRLEADWGQLVQELGSLGNVKIITRNEHAVHEKVGLFDKISAKGPMGIVLNREIDLRLFLTKWAFGFAVTTKTNNGTRKSFQFFDHEGTAIHKIFLTEDSHEDAYQTLIDRYKATEQSSELLMESYDPASAPVADNTIDLEALKSEWAALKDVHQFHGLLRKHNCDRHQSFRLIGKEFAEKLTPTALKNVLEQSVTDNISIMVFVGNKGCIQIHTGHIEKVKEMGPWINILDPGFNLHLRQDHIAEIWLVRKPTKDGVITTLEIFNDKQENFALLCGEREMGQPENTAWQNMVENLERHAAASEAAE